MKPTTRVKWFFHMFQWFKSSHSLRKRSGTLELVNQPITKFSGIGANEQICNMKNGLVLIACILLLVSCEKTVNIDVPTREPRLVINGLLEKNRPVEVGVGKSRGVLDPVSYQGSWYEQYVVKTAQAVLYENNVSLDTLVYEPAVYKYRATRNIMFREGYTYTVRATAPGFDMAEANALLPSQSVIAELRFQKNVRTNSSGMTVDEITLKLNDPAAEKNFYLVQVNNSYGNRVYCVGTTDKDIEAIGDETDPLEPDNCFDGGALLMRDDNFNGAQKQLKLTVESFEMAEYTDPSTGNIYRPYVKLYRITEDQFKYVKSYHSYNSAGDNPFAEPVNVYTNVKNGYGIFSLSTVAVDTLR